MQLNTFYRFYSHTETNKKCLYNPCKSEEIGRNIGKPMQWSTQKTHMGSRENILLSQYNSKEREGKKEGCRVRVCSIRVEGFKFFAHVCESHSDVLVDYGKGGCVKANVRQAGVRVVFLSRSLAPSLLFWAPSTLAHFANGYIFCETLKLRINQYFEFHTHECPH